MLGEQTVLQTAKDISYRSLGEDLDTVILSLGTGQLYTCNQTAAEFLSAVDGSRSFGEIVYLLAEEFEVSREQLRADMELLAQELMDEGLLIAVR